MPNLVYKKTGNDLTVGRRIYRSTQPKPYIKPLPYKHYSFIGSGPVLYIHDPSGQIPLYNGTVLDGLGGVAEASNKALNKLYERLGQSEALLVAWKERQSAVSLLTSNLRRLVTIARAVKRRDPKIVRRVLKRNPKAKDIIKTPAGLWLEYHFAIVPTILDIHHACGVLGFDFPVDRLSFSSASLKSRENFRGSYQWYYGESFRSIVKLTGEIYALNPNGLLASSLGFGQPLSVAWEMTPFSWFVDYFVNVGEMCKNLEPRFPSVKTRYETMTKLILCDGKRGYCDSNPHAVKYMSYNSVCMERTLGWPSYQLTVSNPLSLKGQQLSYIAAVLAGMLTGMKPKS